jgi:murein DD-endopeptidase MepM/ murein hydrolase activator NlpD
MESLIQAIRYRGLTVAYSGYKVKNRLTKSFILGVNLIAAAGASYALMTPTNNSSTKFIPATIPELSSSQIEPVPTEIIESVAIKPAEAEPQFQWKTHIIKSGESLSGIFSTLNLDKIALLKITHTNKTGKMLARISPGKTLKFRSDLNGQLEKLIYQKNIVESIVATRTEDHFTVEIQSKDIERKLTSAHGTINDSFYLAGKKANLSEKLIMQMAEIFAWDIDFALNLRNGDKFTVLYEKLYVEDQEISGGEILAAEFVNRGQLYRAVRFKDAKGSSNYYTPDGKSLKKAFLRTPVPFARISSRFNLRRKHPVLNRIRAHKGVDYAANTGTPIKSTGDGKIIFRGRKGGYGNVVIVQHGKKYSTLYAHMSKFKRKQKIGSKVKQGQIIGYVGKTGLATGPHLHYEFRINGAHRNPLTVKLPKAAPIPKEIFAEFTQQTKQILAKLDLIKASTLLAQNQL